MISTLSRSASIEYLQKIFQQLKAITDRGPSVKHDAITSTLFGFLLKAYSRHKHAIPGSVKEQLGNIENLRQAHFVSLCRNLDSVPSRESDSRHTPELQQRFALLLQNIMLYEDLLVIRDDARQGALYANLVIGVLICKSVESHVEHIRRSGVCKLHKMGCSKFGPYRSISRGHS